MKLRQLQINDNEFSLSFEAEGKELKSLFELFDELKAVALMVDEAKDYRISVADDRLDERGRRVLRLAASLPLPERVSVTGLRPVSKLMADEIRFLHAVMDNIELRGDWLTNDLSPEPRLERTIVSTFYKEGELKEDFGPWREKIENQTSGIENPGIGAVALLPKKAYLLAENDLERQEKKDDAMESARKELEETALKFYHGTLNQEEEPLQEGVSGNGSHQE